MTGAPKLIWARPVGATKDWSKSDSGPWSLDNPYGTSTEYIRADIADEMLEALRELSDLMDAVVCGEYLPDSFTTQPARAAIDKAESGVT